MRKMLKLKIIFVMITVFSTCHSASISNGLDKMSRNVPYYTAAVVELNPNQIFHGSKDVMKNVYNIIKSDDIKEADIVIFPESILNEPSTAILLPDSISFCDDPYANYLLRLISCGAREAHKYVVIDLNIKIKCSMDDQPFCANATDSTNLYNMAMVFNRYGDIVAKYRKYHLFNEHGVQQTMKPDLVTFKTNFNVTFGVCICFDLMFAEPAVNLINQGVKHFVYPTMWFSELPYLSATQFQQSWAYANDVTLLAANANLPTLKSSGSGIYAGRLGALKAFITETAKTKILIAKVPIDRHLPDFNRNTLDNRANSGADFESDSQNKVAYPYLDRSFDTFDLLQDDLSKYNVKFLNFTESASQAGTVCNNGICCKYNIEVSANGMQDQTGSYLYAISVFHGHRYFKSVKELLTAQTVCSLIACTEMDSKKSCGKRFASDQIRKNLRFEKLVLETELPSNYGKAMPNTLTTELLPLCPTEFEYNTMKMDEIDKNAVRFQLNVPKSNLLTFAIYSRDYNKDITN